MGYEYAAARAHVRSYAEQVLEQDYAAVSIQTWPVIPRAWLEKSMGYMSPADRTALLRHKIMPYASARNQNLYAALDDRAAAYAHTRGLTVSGRIHADDYSFLVGKYLSGALLRKATYRLVSAAPWASARHRLSVGQLIFVTACVCGMSAVAIQGHGGVLLAATQTLMGCFFMAVVMLRAFCVLPLPPTSKMAQSFLADKDLPCYTVLVPLFRETAVLSQLIAALCNLDYPRNRLDIKIIIEEDDRQLRLMLTALWLPPEFEIVVVPRGRPQTKPRALNYAMQFARGSLATIYDGEDIPQPNQLRMAAAAFARAPQSTACLQAALDVFNPAENWLTRQFTAEYAGLFHVILPALAAYRLPLPLGGTSNHFRVAALNVVGGWDPFNVTEDADLGIRLSRNGYDTGILRSSTSEEAPSHLKIWINQRRRWLKGFLQTWLVHNRNPVQLLQEVGLRGFVTVQLLTIGIFASALLHPPLLLITLVQLVPSLRPTTTLGLFLYGFGLAVLLLGYVSAILTSRKGLRHIGAFGWRFTLLTIPAYWLLMSIAAWLALRDFLVAPFYWHKTSHGLSRLSRPDSQNLNAPTSRQRPRLWMGRE